MLGEFWKSVSGKLADRWAGLGSAAVFWAGLLVVWLGAHDGWATARQASGWLQAQSDLGLLVVLLGGLLLASAPAVLVTRVTAPVLRLLEGYWPTPAKKLWCRRVTAKQQQLQSDQDAFRSLAAAKRAAAKSGGRPMTRDEVDEYSRLDWSLHHRPGAPARVMPTRVGNVLRAAEDRPRLKYGLDSVIVWPRLWLVLPDTTRQELAAARGALDSAVAAVVWGLLFSAAVPLMVGLGRPAHWLLPGLVGVTVGAGTAAAAWVWWVPQRAMVFADLLDSAFDLHRFTLYEQLRWPLPANAVDEHQSGEALTKYLWLGSRSALPTFSTPPG